MIEVLRSAITVNKLLNIQRRSTTADVTYKEGILMATLNGAKGQSLWPWNFLIFSALRLDEVGSLKVGKKFDALRIKCDVADSPMDFFENDSPELLLNRFVSTGDDRNIVEVYTDGVQRVNKLPSWQ